MMQAVLLFALLSAPVAMQAACFHTTAEAALQAGVRDGEGFQLEGIRVDRLGGGRWATVRSCVHPERPGLAVRMGNAVVERTPADSRPDPGVSAPRSAAAVGVAVGDVVEATMTSATTRVVVTAIAQTGGLAGQTIRVRLAPLANSGEPRFANAVVRSPTSVELEPGL